MMRISLLLLLFAAPAWGQASPAFKDSVTHPGYDGCNWPGLGVNCFDGVGFADSLYAHYPSVTTDDVMFLVIAASKTVTTVTISTPSGWALIDTTTQGVLLAGLYWKRYSAETPGDSLKVDLPNAGGVAGGAIISFSGCVTEGTPYEQMTVKNQTASGYSSSEITPVEDYNLVVCLTAAEDNTVTSGLSGWTNDFELTTTYGTDLHVTGSSIAQSSATTETSASGTTANSVPWVSWTFALNSAVGGGGARRSNVSN